MNELGHKPSINVRPVNDQGRPWLTAIVGALLFEVMLIGATIVDGVWPGHSVDVFRGLCVLFWAIFGFGYGFRSRRLAGLLVGFNGGVLAGGLMQGTWWLYWTEEETWTDLYLSDVLHHSMGSIFLGFVVAAAVFAGTMRWVRRGPKDMLLIGATSSLIALVIAPVIWIATGILLYRDDVYHGWFYYVSMPAGLFAWLLLVQRLEFSLKPQEWDVGPFEIESSLGNTDRE